MERTEHLDAITQLLEGGDGTATDAHKTRHFPDQPWPTVSAAIAMIVSMRNRSGNVYKALAQSAFPSWGEFHE